MKFVFLPSPRKEVALQWSVDLFSLYVTMSQSFCLLLFPNQNLPSPACDGSDWILWDPFAWGQWRGPAGSGCARSTSKDDLLNMSESWKWSDTATPQGGGLRDGWASESWADSVCVQRWFAYWTGETGWNEMRNRECEKCWWEWRCCRPPLCSDQSQGCCQSQNRWPRVLPEPVGGTCRESWELSWKGGTSCTDSGQAGPTIPLCWSSTGVNTATRGWGSASVSDWFSGKTTRCRPTRFWQGGWWPRGGGAALGRHARRSEHAGYWEQSHWDQGLMGCHRKVQIQEGHNAAWSREGERNVWCHGASWPDWILPGSSCTPGRRKKRSYYIHIKMKII